MLQPGREGGTVHYQQLLGNIIPHQIPTQDDFQSKTAYGPDIWYNVTQSIGHTRHINLETGQDCKRKTL